MPKQICWLKNVPCAKKRKGHIALIKIKQLKSKYTFVIYLYYSALFSSKAFNTTSLIISRVSVFSG